jgi:hypothetical protein
LTCSRKAVEVDVLGHVVNRDIETRGVSHVEDIERELQEERSVISVIFVSEMSARLCQDWRRILRWPSSMKFVSYGSLEGIAPFKAPGAKHNSLSGHFSLRFAP